MIVMLAIQLQNALPSVELVTLEQLFTIGGLRLSKVFVAIVM